MNEPYLTIAEIEAKYPNQWVLVSHLKKGRDGLAVGGVVRMRASDRAEFDRRLMEATEGHPEFAIFYTGTQSADDDILEPLSESA